MFSPLFFSMLITPLSRQPAMLMPMGF